MCEGTGLAAWVTGLGEASGSLPRAEKKQEKGALLARKKESLKLSVRREEGSREKKEKKRKSAVALLS